MVSVVELVGSVFIVWLVYKLIISFNENRSKGVVVFLTSMIRAFPWVDTLIHNYVSSEVIGFIGGLNASGDGQRTTGRVSLKIPETGQSYDNVLSELQELKAGESDVANKVFAYKYAIDSQGTLLKLQEQATIDFTEPQEFSDNHQQLVEIAQAAFMNENALNPIAFPSLRKFELEVVSMTANMLNAGDQAVGSLTSGGTESILMAVKTYRDFARKHKPGVTMPEILAPITIHPAFEKAAEYFGLSVVHTPVNSDMEADVLAMEKAITNNTVMLAASAPQYPHGVLDPIHKISQLAIKHGLPFHVDACYGGFMLPWLNRVGIEVPLFDFRCHGVTSMSADLHKFGYTPKGASVVVYRNEALRRHQLFAYTKWPGGLFGSTTMAGTRSGSVMAAAWVTLKHLGQDGYVEKAKALQKTTSILTEGIQAIEGLAIVGKPIMNCFAVKSTLCDLDILVVAEAMELKGWRMERQQLPDCLHFSILPQHIGQESTLLSDLRDACKASKGKKAKPGGSAAMYGMIASIPDQAIVDDFVLEYFSKVIGTGNHSEFLYSVGESFPLTQRIC